MLGNHKIFSQKVCIELLPLAIEEENSNITLDQVKYLDMDIQ